MNRFLTAGLLLIASAPCVGVQAQFEGMKYRIPSDANTLVLIDAEKMFGSPVADRDRWQARRQAAYDAGISALPPDATSVMLAARMDHEYCQSIWEMGMVKLREDRNVTTVAARYGGEIDEIGGRSAVRLPSDHYVVQMMSNMLAAYTPANRQDVSRWLQSTDVGARPELPTYLEQAFGYAEKVGTPIVMALDISGCVSEPHCKFKLSHVETLKNVNIPISQLAKLISGVKGITLGITLQDEAVGAIRVDFSESPTILAEVGKPLLIELLQNQGAMIEDFRNWIPSIEGNTFLLRGTFSPSGARRVLSVLELPRSLADARLVAESPGSDHEGTAARLASQQYFKNVVSMLDDLREKPKRDHFKTFGQAAIWYDRYARKIDRLSMLGVDKELLDYGVDVASMLREAEMAMKGVGMRGSVRTAQNNPVSSGYGWSFGGYRAGRGYDGGLYGADALSVEVGAGRATLQAKGRSDAVIRLQERVRGASSVQQIWQALDETTATVRRAMINKYSADF